MIDSIPIEARLVLGTLHAQKARMTSSGLFELCRQRDPWLDRHTFEGHLYDMYGNGLITTATDLGGDVVLIDITLQGRKVAGVPLYVSHLKSHHDPLRTSCGQAWQRWQAPPSERWRSVSPEAQPPSGTRILLCPACQKLSFDRETAA